MSESEMMRNPHLQPSIGSSTRGPKVSVETLKARLKLLLSSYRRDQYADPDGFVLQVGLLMSEFEEDVILYATDPRTGIQNEYPRFPPNVGEIGQYLKTAQKRVNGLRLIAERGALGYCWVDDPANNRLGFYSQAGQRLWRTERRHLAAFKSNVDQENRLDQRVS